MALLTLKDVGKIYVSENNVAVGIRGVNLSFDRGEFVAITGKSGSGKSTLLNVISGMDSYEEGELYVEGQTTSHYLQSDWEEYRAKYISFIFQDYNIIESFTVLQNVELALMHIEDKKARRDRALELIERVGLTSHAKQKGSRLSGGQKQRTVIARALAKDSPVILADEPTGNLDSTSSKEIVELLREVSKDKLLIVVTHNFEQVAECATRHIRIFDGAVESDQTLVAPSEKEDKASRIFSVQPTRVRGERKTAKTVKDGITLGGAIFTAKPKLSTFLCLLMLLAALGVFFITAFCGGGIAEAFQPTHMFHPMEGRLVVASQTGEAANEEKVKALAEQCGATRYLRYDAMLDADLNYLQVSNASRLFDFDFNYGQTYGDDIYGRYPAAPNEVFLYVHISDEEDVGSAEFLTKYGSVGVLFNGAHRLTFEVVGVKYFYDNNLKNQAVFTKEGFDAVTALYYFQAFRYSRAQANVTIGEPTDGKEIQIKTEIASTFEMEENKAYLASEEYEKLFEEYPAENTKTSIEIMATKLSGDADAREYAVLDAENLTRVSPDVDIYEGYGGTLFVHPTLLVKLMEGMFDGSYNQFSLFFESDREAQAAAEVLGELGYAAVLSSAEIDGDAVTVIMRLINGTLFVGMWIAFIIFLAFFLNLCSRRALEAFKGDMAIMRSMGISVGAIKIGMHVRMLVALLPAYIGVALTAVFVYVNPALNRFFTYLYAWQYIAMFAGLLLIVLRITRKQIGALFSASVKKSLKGDNAV